MFCDISCNVTIVQQQRKGQVRQLAAFSHLVQHNNISCISHDFRGGITRAQI